MSKEKRIWYNREYFGYLAGFREGKIAMLNQSALPLLEAGLDFHHFEGHLLNDFQVRDNFYLETPPLVWLEITKACNLTCPHCYIDGGRPREKELESAEIHALIDQLADMGVWAVAFTGGEPTLHPQFIDFVIHARERNLLVGIATHGLHLTHELLARLPTDGVIISISMDNLHINGSQPDREFATITKTLMRCRQHGFNANIMTNTNRKNIDDLDKIISWAEENNISIRSVPFSPIGERAKANKFLENTADDAVKASRFWLREVELEHKYHEEVGLCVGSIFNYGLTLAYMTNRCSSGRFLCYICADGTVYPCTMCAAEKIFEQGNIRDYSFRDLWRKEWKFRDFSWDNFKVTCASCPLNDEMYYCSSRCPAMSHARHGDYNSCGASDFEKISLVIRTALMQSAGL